MTEQGIFYGIGVGPGDPELLTLKAVRLLNELSVIAVPISDTNDIVRISAGNLSYIEKKAILSRCTAFQIACQAVKLLFRKNVLFLPMPMIKDKKELGNFHDSAAEIIHTYLKNNISVAFLTLGDPTVYSTFLYVQKRIIKKGSHTEIINGIPSFCAAAARLGIGLSENKEELHIIPATYQIKEAQELNGTKVFMKAGKKIKNLKKELAESKERFYMVEKCGMEGEKIYTDVSTIPDNASYYSLIILKPERKGKNL